MCIFALTQMCDSRRAEGMKNDHTRGAQPIAPLEGTYCRNLQAGPIDGIRPR